METQPMLAQPVPYPGAAARTDVMFDPTGKYKLTFSGAFAAVEVAVSQGDGIKAESGAMVTMSNNLDVKAKMEGSVGSALLRCCCTSESFFTTHFTIPPGKNERGDVLLAPAVPGEIILLHLDGQTSWSIQPGSFLASDDHVSTKTRMLNISQGCCGGSGLFVIETSGPGRMLVNTYGSIARYDLQPGEQRIIDNGYLVAWTSAMQYEIKLASKGIGSAVFSGEGLVCLFTGPGSIYVQTRSIRGLANALIPYLPVQTNNNMSAGDIDIDF